MDGSGLTIIIPAHNEGPTIRQVVEKTKNYGNVIVVSDRSTDDTSALARTAGATVIDLAGNAGYEGALDAGFKAAADAGAQYMLTIDADGQHPDELIPAFLEKLKTSDVVCGIRDRQQRFSETLFCWAGRLLYGIDDPLCGMKAYRRVVYEALGHFDRHKTIGTELAFFAAGHGFKIDQIAVHTKPRLDEPRFGNAWKANWRICKALVRALLA